MGNYYNDYTFTKFLQEKQGTGITILSGYTGYLFSDLPTDLSDAVNVITYKGNNQKSGIYSQGFISDPRYVIYDLLVVFRSIVLAVVVVDPDYSSGSVFDFFDNCHLVHLLFYRMKIVFLLILTFYCFSPILFYRHWHA